MHGGWVAEYFFRPPSMLEAPVDFVLEFDVSDPSTPLNREGSVEDALKRSQRYTDLKRKADRWFLSTGLSIVQAGMQARGEEV